MIIELKKINAFSFAEAFAVGVFEDTPKSELPSLPKLSKQDGNYLNGFTASVNGETGETKIAYLPSGAKIIFLGLGKKADWSVRSYALFARKTVQMLKSNRFEAGALMLNNDILPANENLLHLIKLTAENALLAEFDFNQYKESPPKGWPIIKSLALYVPSITKLASAALREATTIATAVNETRKLVNTPGGDMTPSKLAGAAVRAGKENGFTVEALDENEIQALGMGGVMGVSKGSSERPRFIIMKYNHKRPGRKSSHYKKTIKPLVFIGKGVTFDTGGLNIKGDEHMYEMHMDMSGGAAVIFAISAIAALKLPVSIVGLVPAVENMPSGQSYRPGDILKTITGKTIEVLNTDAEGRVILADALGYAVKFLDPALMVDVATLTGAAMVALGQRFAGLFTNRPGLETELRRIGEESGDYVWPLPASNDYDEEIKGTFGDVANLGKTRYGGATTGAVFLKQFADNKPWVHLDIAPVMTTIDSDLLAKGAKGFGVRYLVELAKESAKLISQLDKKHP